MCAIYPSTSLLLKHPIFDYKCLRVAGDYVARILMIIEIVIMMMITMILIMIIMIMY